MQIQGTPERNFLEGYEGCDAAWAAWSSGSKEFPGSCLMLLNVIKSMGCSRELTEGNWKSNRRGCIVNTYICMHRCKINQHALPGSTIPRNMLPLLSLRVGPILFIASRIYMVRHRSRRRLVLRGCIPRYDLSL